MDILFNFKKILKFQLFMGKEEKIIKVRRITTLVTLFRAVFDVQTFIQLTYWIVLMNFARSQ